MTCVGCARAVPSGAAFCPACGTAQPAAACASCSAELVPGAAFCLRCGAPTGLAAPAPTRRVEQPLAAAATSEASERRLTSVLFADLVSYTTLSESRDTEDVRDLLSAYFDACSTVVRRYGGAVEKFIGDAVMAVWGVPAAHEDDAERAVRAGLELVAAVTELGESLGVGGLALRAGVVTGEVSATVGATGQGMVAGDPVNTAARIQAAAGSGEVWVDANTRAMTAAAVTYTDMGEHELKGKTEPMRLFRVGTVVAGVGGDKRVDGLEAPLAGRDRELRLVKELFHTAVESGRPRLVVLDGEAGVGKTRLGWEFDKYTSGIDTELMWHRGRCLSYGDGVAYWALAEMVRARLGLLDEDSGEVVADRIGTALAEYVPDPEERAWMRPRLASLIGEEEGGEFAREDLFSAWTRFFERLGDHSDAVVLVIDDGQYADAGLLDFLEHLLANARTRVFVLLLARPELLEARPQLGGRRATSIQLEPLADAAMGALVDGLVEGLPRETRAALVNRSEGIPLFAVETVRALIDRDLVQPSDGRYVVAAGQSVDLSTVAAPASLHALVAARLDGLSAEERRVVSDASVLGLSFTREGIGILASDVPDLDAVLLVLHRKEILATEVDRFSAERGQYRFVQTVVRQVAYSTLSRRDRKSRHLAVAEHLARQSERNDELAMVIAQHLLDAVEAAPDDTDVPDLRRRAAHLLALAGDRACALGAYADGLRLYRSALERIGEDESRAPVLEKAADAALMLGQLQETVDLAAASVEILDRIGDRVAAGRVAAMWARGLYLAGDARGAVRLARDRYAELAGVTGAGRAACRLSNMLARALMAIGEHDEAIVAQAAALRLAEEVGEPEELAASMQTLVVQQFARGSSRVGLAVLRDLVDLCRQHGFWQQLTSAQQNLGLIMTPISLREGLEMQRASIDTARDHGLAVVAQFANLATTLWRAGEWRALDEIIAETAESDEIVDPGAAVILLAVDACRTAAGLPSVGLDVDPGVADNLNFLGWHELLLAMRCERAGDAEAAVGHARTAVRQIWDDAELSDDFINIWPPAMRIALDSGDLDAAQELLAVVADAQPGLVSVPLAAHLRVLRALTADAGGGGPAVEADLRDGIAMLGDYGAVPDRARAQEDLGRWLVRQGRGNEAAEHLEAARATYADLGATAWLEKLDDVLSNSAAQGSVGRPA